MQLLGVKSMKTRPEKKLNSLFYCKSEYIFSEDSNCYMLWMAQLSLR